VPSRLTPMTRSWSTTPFRLCDQLTLTDDGYVITVLATTFPLREQRDQRRMMATMECVFVVLRPWLSICVAAALALLALGQLVPLSPGRRQ